MASRKKKPAEITEINEVGDITQETTFTDSGLIFPYNAADVRPVIHRKTPDEYIAEEYPWLERSQDLPRIMKALLREVVIGRMR